MGLSRDLGREKNQWEEGDGKGSTVHMQWVLRCVMRETGGHAYPCNKTPLYLWFSLLIILVGWLMT